MHVEVSALADMLLHAGPAGPSSKGQRQASLIAP